MITNKNIETTVNHHDNNIENDGIKLENSVDILIHEIKQPLLCILVLGERLEHLINTISPEVFKKQLILQRDITSLLTSVQQMREILSSRMVISQMNYTEDNWGLRLEQHYQAMQATAEKFNILYEIENKLNFRNEGPDIKAVWQIISNLITNAFEALKELNNIDKKVKLIIKEEKENIIFEVHDSGKGLNLNIEQQIFNKGFTTKLTQGGSGYGLWISKNIAILLGGNLTIKQSEILGGASFILQIPYKKIANNSTDVAA